MPATTLTRPAMPATLPAMPRALLPVICGRGCRWSRRRVIIRELVKTGPGCSLERSGDRGTGADRACARVDGGAAAQAGGAGAGPVGSGRHRTPRTGAASAPVVDDQHHPGRDDPHQLVFGRRVRRACAPAAHRLRQPATTGPPAIGPAQPRHCRSAERGPVRRFWNRRHRRIRHRVRRRSGNAGVAQSRAAPLGWGGRGVPPPRRLHRTGSPPHR